jgi:hypothetical protein
MGAAWRLRKLTVVRIQVSHIEKPEVFASNKTPGFSSNFLKSTDGKFDLETVTAGPE